MNETRWELDIDRQEHETRQQRGTIACSLKGLCHEDIAVFIGPGGNPLYESSSGYVPPQKVWF